MFLISLRWRKGDKTLTIGQKNLIIDMLWPYFEKIETDDKYNELNEKIPSIMEILWLFNSKIKRLKALNF